MLKDSLARFGASILNLIVTAGLALLFGVFVMLMWNWLMPMLFSLPTIGYFEGWGISFLSGLLFKNSPMSDLIKDNDK